MHVNDWSFRHPAEVIAGRNCIERFFDLHKVSNQERILIITTKGAVKRGSTIKITRHIQNKNILIWDNVKPNPQICDLDKTTNELRHFKPSFIIAIGGGSVLDTAKILSLTTICPETHALKKHFTDKKEILWRQKIPLTAIPTTAGSGAEATPFATIWDLTAQKKHSLNHNSLYPDHVLLDPELCLSLPFKQTLYSGLDVISHALESLWNINRNHISQAFAIQALNLANKSFMKVLNNQENLEARQSMQTASLLAGMAISQTRTAIAHSISYPLTIHFNIPHGLACSFTLPELIESNTEILKETGSWTTIQDTFFMLKKLNLDQEISKYADRTLIISKIKLDFNSYASLKGLLAYHFNALRSNYL